MNEPVGPFGMHFGVDDKLRQLRFGACVCVCVYTMVKERRDVQTTLTIESQGGEYLLTTVLVLGVQLCPFFYPHPYVVLLFFPNLYDR